jgi:hypothetical protein
MALQHLRSSTANKRPAPGSMSEGQLALNSEAASPGLFFKNSNGALVKVGPIHVGATAPNITPASGGTSGNSTGESWLDTSVTPNELKVWNGSAFVSALPVEIPVSKLQDGAARQLLQTDAAGTDVEWASNIDIPGTLDVTGAATFDSTVVVNTTGSLTLPDGTTAQRPGAPLTGDVRFNTTIIQFEGYNGTAWGTIGGGAKGGGVDQVFFENDQTVTTNYTLTSSKNAVSAGPVTIASGITVTIPSGVVWVVV